MADIADDADRTIQLVVDDAVNRAARAKPVIEPRGYCLFCGAKELPDGSPWPAVNRWCDADCRADWSRHTGVR